MGFITGASYEKGNSRNQGTFFQKTIDNGTIPIRKKGKVYQRRRLKRFSPTISREKMINLVRCDIDLNQPWRQYFLSGTKGRGFNDYREKNSPSLKHTRRGVVGKQSSSFFFSALAFFSLLSGKVTCFKSGSLANSSNTLVQVVCFVNFTAIGVPQF